MNVSDEFLYWSQCESKLIKACKFCTKCGAKIKTVVEEKSTENDSSLARNLLMIILTLKVMKELGFSSVKNRKERGMKTLQARNQLTAKFSFLARETITINIGLMESTDKSDYNLGPIRESRLRVNVSQQPRFFQQEF